MTDQAKKPRLTVVSPFLSKNFGTERAVVEWLNNLPDTYEIHLYSQDVEGLDLARFVWHRIPKIPGPHILKFLWWIAANHIARFIDNNAHGLAPDLIYSPGINCFDADVISVHIVFAEYLFQAKTQLTFSRNSLSTWPVLLHRRLYYRLIIALEKRIYTDAHTMLVLYARKTARDLERFYGRRDPLPVLYLGIDHAVFNPSRRDRLRNTSRSQFGFGSERFVLLVVGNDLRKKGIGALLEALGQLRDLPIDLIAAGREDPGPFEAMARDSSLQGRVKFLPARPDVEVYYAAADVYTGPSLEDTFALPPMEAMACGLPVIVSAENGTCEIITHELNGLILQKATDSAMLAILIRKLYEDADFRNRLGNRAAETVREYTWERNGRDLATIFDKLLAQKR